MYSALRFHEYFEKLSLIWLGGKLGSTLKLQHFLQRFPDSSVDQINFHFLRSFLCWSLLKKGYLFGILNTLSDTSVYCWLFNCPRHLFWGKIFFGKIPLAWANSFKARAYIYICVSLLALLGKSPSANCEVPWFGWFFPVVIF